MNLRGRLLKDWNKWREGIGLSQGKEKGSMGQVENGCLQDGELCVV